ncbi:hypothetical protein H9L13_02130 [Sphingomonas lutea]|uniref:Uncharacterized protein n=1 Tax=Sphingomonas lutea TaxID=1045317 RepID=A0A7G9SIS9_9SPHN|nr:hypothetical protein [Sphingomonas lutea]QNN67754.1 hypothetical protein H9L13_02130 [Sphingomonas lutea]
MRLGLPKPLRGWRAFAGEVGIIVLGVLIALGAQEIAEDLSDRAKAREARELIRTELATYLGRLESRLSINQCLTNRINEIQALVDTAARGGPIKRPTWIGRPQFWTALSVSWDAAAQSGHAALLPAAELAEYATMYDWMQNSYDSMLIEQASWARIRTLEHLDYLTPETAFHINAALQDARYRAWRIHSQTKDLQRIAKRVGLQAKRNDIVGTRGPCYPMTTPWVQAARVNPAGEP